MTAAPVYCGLATLRRHWRASVAAALLIALACAVPTAAATAARRSGSVVDRVTEELQLADVELQLESIDEAGVQTIRDLPDVEAAGLHSILFLRPTGTGLMPFLEFFAKQPQASAVGCPARVAVSAAAVRAEPRARVEASFCIASSQEQGVGRDLGSP